MHLSHVWLKYAIVRQVQLLCTPTIYGISGQYFKYLYAY